MCSYVSACFPWGLLVRDSYTAALPGTRHTRKVLEEEGGGGGGGGGEVRIANGLIRT